MKKAYIEAAETVIGKTLRDNLHVRKDRKVKRSIKADKRKWIDNIAGESEKAARNRAL